MKKWMAVLLTGLLMLSCIGFAEGTTESGANAFVTANGTEKCKNVLQITAPYSGVLMPYDWETGDEVKGGEMLFTMDTVKVYAPADGKVTALFAKEGDSCQDVISQYNMVACLERTYAQRADCSIANAYDDEDNRIIHTGEKVYFEQSDDDENEGEGRVISVSGDDYQVEVTAGKFESGDKIKIYRDEKMGTKTRIGTGTIKREADLPVTGSGRIVRMAVSKGQSVKKGQLLFETAAADADIEGAKPEILSPAAGALEITAVGSQQVYKGQVLAKVHDLSNMQIVAEVDEMDLDRLKEGDTLSVELDRYPGKKVNGTVTEIAKIGIPKQNASYYNVTLNISTNLEVLPGMNATVLLPEKAE